MAKKICRKKKKSIGELFAESMMEQGFKPVKVGPSSAEDIERNAKIESSIKGLCFLIRDLEEEMKKPEFFAFNVEYDSASLSSPYPSGHELLRLIVTHRSVVLPSVTQKKSFNYLRNAEKDGKWYRCNNYRKVGSPLR